MTMARWPASASGIRTTDLGIFQLYLNKIMTRFVSHFSIMKSFPLLCLWLFITPLLAEEIPGSIILHAERFSLAQAEAHDLLLAGLSDQALHEEILKRVSAKSATLDQFVIMRGLSLRGLSGRPIKLAGNEELPYAKDFEPAQMAGDLTFADPAGASALEAVRSFIPPPAPVPPPPEPLPTDPPLPPPPPPAPAPEIKPKPHTGKPVKVGIGLQTSVCPSELAFKSLGDTWEVDASVRPNGKLTTLNWKTESTRWLGDVSYNGAAQPNFQTQRLHGTTLGKLDQAVLVGTCSKAVRSGVEHSQQEDVITLQFLTAFAPALPKLDVPPKPPANDPFAAPPAPQPPSFPQVLNQEQIDQKSLRFQFEVISLPKDTAHALCLSHPTDPALLTQLQEMVRAHTAQREASLQFSTRSGVPKKSTELTPPLTYFTDFSQYHMPSALTVSDPKILDLLRLHGGGTAEEAAGIAQEMITVTRPEQTTKRTLGTLLELNSILSSDGITMIATIRATMEQHLGQRTLGSDEKPVFAKRELNTSVMLQAKVPLLLGTLSPPSQTGAPGGNATDTVALAFLTGFVE